MNSRNTLSQSSSSSGRATRNQVFLSFSGEDAANSFADHLCAALRRKGLFIFEDDNRLREGDSISPKLLNAIDQSRISIVVFSTEYADSIRCLEELAKISGIINKPGYIAIPIFYNVDPSEARKQSGCFQKAFAKHEERFGSNSEKVQRWRLAMNQVADRSGFGVHQSRSESELIDGIVEFAMTKLGHKISGLADDLVGMESRLEALEYFLDLDSDDDAVRFVGICGMVGSGKTTLAVAAYNKISHRFDSSCFLPSVSVRDPWKDLGLIHLQQKLLRQILNENMRILDDDAGTNLISTRLSHLKTLIVVDDADDSEKLQKLVGNSDSEWFGAGSRVIIVTRDERVLRDHGVDRIYKVQLLNEDESLQLLCRRTFKRDKPLPDFEKLTHAILEPTKGLPLAIVYFGSLLVGRSALSWESASERMKDNNPPRGLMDALRTSFDSLQEEDKEIFLDIACFFNGDEENYVMEILGYCGFHLEVGVRALLDKSLVSIVNGTFWMHDLMQILGRYIVRGENPCDPTKWSRLWLYQDFEQVVRSNTMVPNLRIVDLRNTRKIMMMPDFRRMPNLERLNLEGCTGLLKLPPSIATLPKPKYLNLKDCSNLISIPNSLFGLSSLRFLNLAGCSKFAECLDFDSWRSSIEVKVLSNEEVSLLEVFSYNTLVSFPEKIKNKKFVVSIFCKVCVCIVDVWSKSLYS